MKAFLGSVVCAVAMSGLSGLSVGANTLQGGTATTSDNQLDSRIEQRIHKDPSLKKHNLDVSVDGGVATLTGTWPRNASAPRRSNLPPSKVLRVSTTRSSSIRRPARPAPSRPPKKRPRPAPRR